MAPQFCGPALEHWLPVILHFSLHLTGTTYANAELLNPCESVIPVQCVLHEAEEQECSAFIPHGPGIGSSICLLSQFILAEALTPFTNTDVVVREVRQPPRWSPPRC